MEAGIAEAFARLLPSSVIISKYARWICAGLGLILCACGGSTGSQTDAEVGLYISTQYSDSQLTAYTDIIYSSRPNAGGAQYTSDVTKATELNGTTLDLRLDIAVPPNATSTHPQPLIVLIHGGGFSAGGKENTRFDALSYARAGYVAASINYRLTPDNTVSSTARLAAFIQASEDAMNAIRYLKANAALYHIDTNRIATIGSSAGGGISLINAIEYDSLQNTTSDFPAVSSKVAASIATGATTIDAYANLDPYLNFQASDSPVMLFHANPTDSVTGATWIGNAIPTRDRINASGNTCTLIAQADMTHVVDLSLGGPWWSTLKPFLWEKLQLGSL
ncbi:MAG: alpha/beta hydrolase [Nitrosomonadales bacterium]|nr:alpha/beta hydrolase [Nitrosomonadales bacterium]